jgi:hypothetical protein
MGFARWAGELASPAVALCKKVARISNFVVIIVFKTGSGEILLR